MEEKPIESPYVSLKEASDITGESPENLTYYIKTDRGFKPTGAIPMAGRNVYLRAEVLAWKKPAPNRLGRRPRAEATESG